MIFFSLTNRADRAMKLFAQRYTYLGGEVVTPPAGIDAIASHDLQTPLRPPSVVQGPQMLPTPTPLVPLQSPPPVNPSNGAMPTYPHPYNPPQAAATTVSANPPPKGPAARVASPLMPPKRPLPEPDNSNSLKRVRRSPPPPVRRTPVPPARRWPSPGRDDRRRERERSPDRVHVPPSISWFLSQLPNPAIYDGEHLLAY
jgi:hypothetical protein